MSLSVLSENAAPSARAVSGHLKLRCVAGESGCTRIREQSYASPIHVGKPWHDDSRLILQMVTPTAGLLEGDRVEIDVEAGPGSSFILTSPSAMRLHAMGANGTAVLEQQFTVASGAFVEVLPHLLIPQADSALCQRTQLVTEADSTLLYWELLAPGRVAHGESLKFREVDVRLDLTHGGEAIARERYKLRPEFWPKRGTNGAPYIGMCFITAPDPDEALMTEIRALHESDAWVGITRLHGKGGLMLRILAADSPALWRTVDQVRGVLYRCLRQEAPPRRV